MLLMLVLTTIAAWCPTDEATLVNFDLDNGKTVSICNNPDSTELTYYYGTFGEPPELRYSGPMLGHIEGVSFFSLDLGMLGDGLTETSVSADVTAETVAAAAERSESRGFFNVHSIGCCGGEESSYIFRTGGWEYAVREGYSRNVNPEIAAELGEYSEWTLITLISPEGERYTIR